MEFIKETSPHLHRKDSLTRMLLDVIIALAPVILMAYISYGLLAFRNFAISIATMVLAEFVYVIIRNKNPYDGNKHTLKEHFLKGVKAYRVTNLLASIVSGAIFALINPVQTDPEWLIYIVLISGALFGMVIGKLVFGGTGSNIFNPAAAGMVFAKLCFGSKFVYPTTWYMDTGSSVTTGGTPLTALAENSVTGVNSYIGAFSDLTNYPILDLFLGRVPGVLGEAFKFAILIGLVYLLIRRAADFRVVLPYLGVYVALMAVVGLVVCLKLPEVNFLTFLAFEVLSGGVLFAAVYMMTDPVTMPINSPGRVLYGIVAACLTVLIRIFGAFPEGAVFSILIVNMLAPVIDYPKWGDQRYTRNKIIVMVSVFAVTILALVLGLVFAK
ncbi:MAG: RnfABCDGE type electron transport complex subunit D [Bacilli bacterium]|nr:RnfABCDGE type electron transport complex subunit D [Bacilli bacterium]